MIITTLPPMLGSAKRCCKNNVSLLDKHSVKCPKCGTVYTAEKFVNFYHFDEGEDSCMNETNSFINYKQYIYLPI